MFQIWSLTKSGMKENVSHCFLLMLKILQITLM